MEGINSGPSGSGSNIFYSENPWDDVWEFAPEVDYTGSAEPRGKQHSTIDGQIKPQQQQIQQQTQLLPDSLNLDLLVTGSASPAETYSVAQSENYSMGEQTTQSSTYSPPNDEINRLGDGHAVSWGMQPPPSMHQVLPRNNNTHLPPFVTVAPHQHVDPVGVPSLAQSTRPKQDEDCKDSGSNVTLAPGEEFKTASRSAKAKQGEQRRPRKQRQPRKNIAAMSRVSREKRKREVQELKMRNQELCKEREEYLDRIAELQSQVQYVRAEGRIDLQMENRLLRAEVMEHKKFVNEFKRFMQYMPLRGPRLAALSEDEVSGSRDGEDQDVHTNWLSDTAGSDTSRGESDFSTTPGLSPNNHSPLSGRDIVDDNHSGSRSENMRHRQQELMRRAAVCGIEQAVSLSLSSSASPNFRPVETKYSMKAYYQNFPLGASAKEAKRIMLRVEMVYNRSLDTCAKAMISLGSAAKALQHLYSHMGDAKLVDLDVKCSLDQDHGLAHETTCKALLQRLQVGDKIGEYVYVNSTQKRPISQACLSRQPGTEANGQSCKAAADCFRPGFVMTATADKESWETFKEGNDDIPHGFECGLEGWVLYPISESQTAVVLVCNYTKQEWLLGSNDTEYSSEYEFISNDGVASPALDRLLGIVDPAAIEVLEQLAALNFQ